jgi:hypothetical protein
VREEKVMSDDRLSDEELGRSREHAEWRARGRALWRWLKARPVESWLFFIGGLLTGSILL